jgi:hypothetical protein
LYFFSCLYVCLFDLRKSRSDVFLRGSEGFGSIHLIDPMETSSEVSNQVGVAGRGLGVAEPSPLKFKKWGFCPSKWSKSGDLGRFEQVGVAATQK